MIRLLNGHTYSLALLTLALNCLALPINAATLMILGDSLSAGYQMSTSQSWPSLLQQSWRTQSSPHTVINASISGETTDGGLRRLPKLLSHHQPDWVLIELGANDGLRGFSPQRTRQNIDNIITQINNASAEVVLMQIRLPRNYGQRYIKQFESIYPQLAAEHSVPLLPFLLDELILQPELIMADGLHPKAQAQPIIAKQLQQQLTPLLNKGANR